MTCRGLLTWHVPPEQLAIAEGGAAATDSPAPPHETQPHHLLRHPSAVNTKTKHGGSSSPAKEKNGITDVTKDVALKMISKKKVKGNEESVWDEMEVLKGLDHPNIVRPLNLRKSDRTLT